MDGIGIAGGVRFTSLRNGGSTSPKDMKSWASTLMMYWIRCEKDTVTRMSSCLTSIPICVVVKISQVTLTASWSKRFSQLRATTSLWPRGLAIWKEN